MVSRLIPIWLHNSFARARLYAEILADLSSLLACTDADAFFFPSYEETEGIVVLEALASHQHTVLRDIPVYNGWIDETSSELCHNVDEFVDSLNKVLNGQVDKREAGYKVAESRSIDLVAYQLVEAYQTVLEM